MNERIRKEQIGELRQLVQVASRAISNQNVENTVESQDLLNVVVDYTYALDTLDNYDYELTGCATNLAALRSLVTKRTTHSRAV